MPTTDVGAFWQKHLLKRKNWIPLGGGTRWQCPPLDLPMLVNSNTIAYDITLLYFVMLQESDLFEELKSLLDAN